MCRTMSRLAYVTWTVAVILGTILGPTVAQPMATSLRSRLMKARDIFNPALGVVSPVIDVLSKGMRSPLVADTVKAVTAGIGMAIDRHEATEKAIFEAGVDTVRAKVTDFVGPHLLTSQTALDMERVGLAFLEAAKGTIERLSVPQGKAGMRLKSAGISLPRLPPRLLCPFDQWSRRGCNRTSRYRTIDGSCNNLDHPLWGKAFTPFERYLPAAYDDGIGSPREASSVSGYLPNARKISYSVHLSQSLPMPDLNHFAMEYGQFVSHDMQRNALSKGYAGSNLDCCARRNRFGCFPIDIPSDDPFFHNRTCMNFVRAVPAPNLRCTLGVREQLNQNTHFIDGSQVYGSDTETAESLRKFSKGLLKTSGRLLPKDTTNTAGCILSNPNRQCFRSGDVRVNQQPALISLHNIWLLEHNRIARYLSRYQQWDDERLYQESRRIVVAMMQHITHKEYLPEILGAATMKKYGLNPRTSGYFTGYSDREKPIIRNAFAAAAFRFGHSMIQRKIVTHDGSRTTGNIDLKDVFLKPDLIYTQGVDGVTRGLTRSSSERVDRYMTDQITRHLFERQPGFGGDLAAINIQRGRDHGIPDYQVWRRYCQLSGSYSHTYRTKAVLRRIYRSPNDMDLFTAGVSEKPVAGGKVGPTFACLMGEQFRSLKEGDRFFYENSGSQAFTTEQLKQIRRTTMSAIICRNTDIDKIQRNAFKDVIPGNPLINCRNIRDIDLSAWTRGDQCIPVNGGWSAWVTTPCFWNYRIKYRLCNNPRKNLCGKPCPPTGRSFRVERCGSRRSPRWRWLDFGRPTSGRTSLVSTRRNRKIGNMGAMASLPARRGVSGDQSAQIEAALSDIIQPGMTQIDTTLLQKAISATNGVM